MDNLIQLIGQQVTPDILRKASAMTGESEAATQSALNAMLPTLVGAFAHKGANENGAKKVMDWVSAQGDSDQFLSGYSGMLDNPESSDWLQDTGGALVSWLMGSKAGEGAGMISSLAGIGGGSSSKLMSMIAPLALAVIGKKALGGNMGAGGLASMFLGQKSFLQNSAPAGLMGLLGLNSLDDLGKVGTSSYTTTTTTTSSTSGASTASASTSGTSTTVSSGGTIPSVSTGTIAAGTAAAGTVAAGAVASVPSFQSGNVAASGISTPSVSVPDVNIATPSVSAPDVNISTPSVSAPDVNIATPSVSTPDVNIATPAISAPSVSAPKMKLPDIDMPTASVDVATMIPEKPLFTQVERDRRDFAFKSGRPDLPGGSAAGVTVDTSVEHGSVSVDRSGGSVERGNVPIDRSRVSADQAKAVASEAITEVVTEEKPLFNKVLLDKRDIPMGNFGGRWFGWTVVTAAISAGVLFLFNSIQPFLGMFMGA